MQYLRKTPDLEISLTHVREGLFRSTLAILTHWKILTCNNRNNKRSHRLWKVWSWKDIHLCVFAHMTRVYLSTSSIGTSNCGFEINETPATFTQKCTRVSRTFTQRRTRVSTLRLPPTVPYCVLVCNMPCIGHIVGKESFPNRTLALSPLSQWHIIR